MRYSVHKPCPALNEYVGYLWSLGDAPHHERERILPSGTIELVINLHEDENSGSTARYQPVPLRVAFGVRSCPAATGRR